MITESPKFQQNVTLDRDVIEALEKLMIDKRRSKSALVNEMVRDNLIAQKLIK